MLSVTSEEEIETLRAQIDRLVSSKEKDFNAKSLVELLERAKGCYVSAELLKRTKIGIIVNRLKNFGHEGIEKLAGEVVDTWKQQITDQNQAAMSGSMAAPRSGRIVDSSNETELSLKRKASEEHVKRTEFVPANSTQSKSASPSGSKVILKKEKLAESGDKNGSTGMDKTSVNNVKTLQDQNEALFQCITPDATRNKCIYMFYDALEVGVEELSGAPEDGRGTVGQEDSREDYYSKEELLELSKKLSIEMETLLYEEHQRTVNSLYKTKFRSKYLNLKEKTNPRLRQTLLRGLLSCRRFMAMTSQEMASEELKKEMEAIEKENLLKVRSAKDNAAETDMFQCGRCKQRKCKYYQMQTRSADEPMTTYVTCVNCGNRWKC